MGTKTGIEWTDATWNCWQGCHKVSPGCKNCYMFADKKRYGQDPNVVVRSAQATFMAPLRWANSAKFGHIKRIFVDSWSDFFVAEADAWRDEAWTIIRATPCFDYQICTKRPERIAANLPADWGSGYRNVWLGVTAENQAMADERIPLLLKTPAAVRFISAEPLLGPVNLTAIKWHRVDINPSDFKGHGVLAPTELWSCNNVLQSRPADKWNAAKVGLDWVICGGESGQGARPMQKEWATSLRDQCVAAGVPFFFKQWGEWLPAGCDGGTTEKLGQTLNCSDQPARVGKKAAGALLDGREWKQFPGVRS